MEIIILLQLVVLFIVIFDPLASLTVFLAASKKSKKKEKQKMAAIALFIAASLSFLVIILGNNLLRIFSTTLDEFKIAGGIVLGILGIKMALGGQSTELNEKNTKKAIAAIIGTPLLTGPATITAILISINDYGKLITLIAVSIVLAITSLLFLLSDFIQKITGETFVQALSTILGLVTIAWGVKFVTEGIKGIFLLI